VGVSMPSQLKDEAIGSHLFQATGLVFWQVYKFLRTFLRWKDEWEEDPTRKNRALKAPREVKFGGVVPPPEAFNSPEIQNISST
jgi:hypothetical protein